MRTAKLPSDSDVWARTREVAGVLLHIREHRRIRVHNHEARAERLDHSADREVRRPVVLRLLGLEVGLRNSVVEAPVLLRAYIVIMQTGHTMYEYAEF